MYSVVLLAAMTSTAETPSLGDFWAKHCFWEDCYPARYGWVDCGYGHRAYYPTVSYGCGCGYQWHRWPTTTCHGCLGAACHGCWGYGNGSWGSYYGGTSSCMGRSCYGCYGGFGGWGVYDGAGYGDFGAYGNFGMYNTVPFYSAPMYTTPMIESKPSNYRPAEIRSFEIKPLEIKPLEIEPLEIEPLDKRSSNPMKTPASVVVKVPADAKVFIDDNLMKSTSTERTFTSPALAEGASYFYTLRVVIEKDGKEIEDVRKVTVRAGEVSRLSFQTIDDRIRPDRTIVDAAKTPIK
jgi:uncharacterized protein (TIGR03000 family)